MIDFNFGSWHEARFHLRRHRDQPINPRSLCREEIFGFVSGVPNCGLTSFVIGSRRWT